MTDFTTNRIECDLSAAARDRRDAMLAELTGFMRQMHRRRRNRTRMAGAAAVVSILGIVALIWSNTSSARRISVDGQVAQRDATRPRAHHDNGALNRIALIETDATALTRCRIPNFSSSAIILDDDALMFTLEQFGRPCGLVKTPTRAWLTENVADSFRKNGAANEPFDHAPST